MLFKWNLPTDIAAIFFQALVKHFPPSKCPKLFKRHTVKFPYSTTPSLADNITSIVKQH